MELISNEPHDDDVLFGREADELGGAADDLRVRALRLPDESTVRAHLLRMATGYAVASRQQTATPLMRAVD